MENLQNEKPQWYVLQTLSGYEKMVQNNLRTMVENNNLQDYIVDIAVPEEEEITEKNGKKKVVMRRKYPCYYRVESGTTCFKLFKQELLKWFTQNMFGIW